MTRSVRLVTWRPQTFLSQRGEAWTMVFELLAEGFDGDGVVDVEEGGAHDVGGLAGPVLEGVFDEVGERDDEAAEVPDA